MLNGFQIVIGQEQDTGQHGQVFAGDGELQK